MRIFVAFLVMMAVIWGEESQAIDRKLTFKIKKISPTAYDYSSVWNPHTQEAIVRMTLIPDTTKSHEEQEPIVLSSAQKVELVVLDVPEFVENCSEVTRWNFEYQPAITEHLMFVTLRGAGCGRVADSLQFLKTRWRFLGVSDAQFLPWDFAIEISR